MDQELLTQEGVASRLDVGLNTVRRMVAEGRLPVVRFSTRRVRIPADAVEQYLAANLAAALTNRAAARKKARART